MLHDKMNLSPTKTFFTSSWISTHKFSVSSMLRCDQTLLLRSSTHPKYIVHLCVVAEGLTEGVFTPYSPAESDRLLHLLHFTLHCVKRSKPIEKRLHPLACGGAAQRTTEGINTKTSEEDNFILCKM